MKIKKILLIVLSLLMICSMIACGTSKKKQEDDPNKVKAQRWAIAIDYGYPDEQEEDDDEGTEDITDPDEQSGDVGEVAPGEVSEVTPGEVSEVTPEEEQGDIIPETEPDDIASDENNTVVINNDNVGSALGTLAAVGTTFYVIMLLVCVVMIVAQWKMFTLAGEAGWKSIVPILNTITMSKIVWGNPWRIFLTLVPIYGIIVVIKTSLATARIYGYGIGIGILLIIAAPLGQAFIAFNPKSDYQGPEEF